MIILLNGDTIFFSKYNIHILMSRNKIRPKSDIELKQLRDDPDPVIALIVIEQSDNLIRHHYIDLKENRKIKCRLSTNSADSCRSFLRFGMV